jgi:hypothetical protein
MNRRKKKDRDTERRPGRGHLPFAEGDSSPDEAYSPVGHGVNIPYPSARKTL